MARLLTASTPCRGSRGAVPGHQPVNQGGIKVIAA